LRNAVSAELDESKVLCLRSLAKDAAWDAESVLSG
jgi:hypothetical protein